MDSYSRRPGCTSELPADSAVGQLPDEIGVAIVAGVLFEHVQ
jgi:hypothetical protein